MKKFLSVMAAACCAMALNATIYTCHVKVTINSTVTEQEEVQVEVNENNGAYDLDLKNFVLISEGVAMPVGNVTVKGVEGVDEHGFTKLNFNGTINITEGNDPQYDFWMGPMLGPVPTVATARFIDTAISGDLFIDLSSTMNQIISVSIFGVAPASEGLEGDVNKDSEVNIADVNRVVDIILSK
jgi:hypothetical protein